MVTRLTNIAASVIGGTIAVSLVNIAWAQSGSVADGWLALHSQGGGYHVFMPPDWAEDHPAHAGPDLSFRPSKPQTVATPGFINCKAGTGPNPSIGTLTQEALDQAVAAGPAPPSATKELLSTLGQGAVVRENGLIQIANHPAYLIVVAGYHETSDTRVHVVAAEVILVRPGRMYSLACTAGARTAEQADLAWTIWRSVFMGIFSTFDSDSR